ncbi:TMP repeat protein [uncultured Mediterranean phage uvDeep-CGR0-KM15-C219]|nr:TMP repeat protein [uncultured Mediterranean phage uvDeep-CGR0-KM15-C219]
MANQIEILVKANVDKAKEEFGGLTQSIARNRKKIGLAMTGIGAGITGIAMLSIKAAQEEAIGISRLDQALKNVGASYDSNKTSIEAVISATQAKTNFGDEEQRDILTKLVTVLGDEKQALEALPAVLDASAASGKNAGSVAETMSKFLAGLTNNSDAVGISVDKSATFTERLGQVMDKVGGQAAAAADPFTQFKNRTGDLSQEFGKVLLPIMSQMAVILEKVTRKVIEFTDAHPNLTKWIGIAVAALGAIMLVVGPLLLALPGLALAFGAVGVAINIAMGPIGLIVLAIAGVTAGVILLWKNWDTVWKAIKKSVQTVGNFVIGIMNNMTLIQRKVIGGIIEGIKKLVGIASKLPFVGGKFDKVQEALEKVQDGLDRGIPKIDFTGDRMVEMGSDFEMAGYQVERATEGIERAEESMVRTTEQMARDSSLAWGSVEDAVLQAQGVTLRSLDEMEAAHKAHNAAVNASWDRFLVNQDATVKKLNAANMSFGDVVEGLATRLGVSTETMAQEIAGFGVKFGDTMGLIEQYGRDSIGVVITDFERMTRSAQNEAALTHGVIQGVVSESERQTRASVERQKALIASIPTLPAVPSGIHRGGGGGSGSTAFIPRGGSSRTANPGLDALRGTGGGLAGYKPGTTFAQIEAALGLANGGIVRRPTLAMIGERGPEAVVPLGRGGGMGSMNVTVNIAEGAIVGVDDLQDTIAQTVRDTAERGGFRGVF